MPDPKVKRQHTRKVVIIVAVVVIVIIGMVVVGAHQAPDAITRQAGAEVACEQAVKNNLKAPSTARFSDETASLMAAPSPNWLVMGSVASQNGFGAMLSTSFSCTVTDLEAKFTQWNLVSLTLGRQVIVSATSDTPAASPPRRHRLPPSRDRPPRGRPSQ